MRLGLLPSHQRHLRKLFKKADAFDDFRGRTRRRFLALGALAFAGGMGAFWCGTKLAPEQALVPAVDPRIADRLARARQLAVGDEAELRSQYVAFLFVFERVPPDAVLWLGFGRLVSAAERDRDERLALHLKQSLAPHLREDGVPALVERLRALIR